MARSVLPDVIHYFSLFSALYRCVTSQLEMHSTEELEMLFWLRTFVSDGHFSVSRRYYLSTTADGTLVRISCYLRFFSTIV